MMIGNNNLIMTNLHCKFKINILEKFKKIVTHIRMCLIETPFELCRPKIQTAEVSFIVTLLTPFIHVV